MELMVVGRGWISSEDLQEGWENEGFERAVASFQLAPGQIFGEQMFQNLEIAVRK